jgi:hypothetical protein
MFISSHDIHWFSRPVEFDLAVHRPQVAAAPALPILGTPLGTPIPGNAERHRATRFYRGYSAGELCGRFDRIVGFWLGGALLGIGGCILGGFMPYSHPVAVTISVLWWGIYLGCLGASIGALLGSWAEPHYASPSRTKSPNTPASFLEGRAIVPLAPEAPEIGLESARV